MNNPTLLNDINNKLTMSSSSTVGLGQGLKMFQVNPNPVAEIHRGCGMLSTSGAKYISVSAENLTITLKSYPIQWVVYTNSNTLRVRVTITGVDNNNNEVTEDIDTSGTSTILSTNFLKMVNDINLKNGNISTNDIIYCERTIVPGIQQILKLELSALYKANPYFMCSYKNGVKRTARFRGITSLYNTAANADIDLHIFKNNSINTDGNGLHLVAYKMYNTSSSVTTIGVTFPKEGIAEMNPGDLAVFYRLTSATAITNINFVWSLHYTL